MCVVVNRYGRRGKIWRRHPELPYRSIRAWQVWNEPNFPAYWHGPPHSRQYTRFMRKTRRAIKRGDKRAKIVLGGLPESPLGISMKRAWRLRAADLPVAPSGSVDRRGRL
ncbi:MAG: hypothetical protein ACRDQB_09415 [Thermocrispum sp.]